MVIIDTSAWVEFFRRDGDALIKLSVKGLLDEFDGALCGPVEMEFFGGARPRELDEIKAAFNIMPYVKNDQKIWRKTATNFSKIRAAGFTVPWNDILIATIAKDNFAAVYSCDKHFPIMSNVMGVRLYEPGYNGMHNPDY